MTIHLEGMGLQGALLAHRLEKYGVPFTWHDNDAPHTAWKASTGAIYPADSINHGPDREAYNVWAAWYANGHFKEAHLEKSSGLAFVTKNPPHKGKYEHREVAGLRFGEQPSFHLNAQTFVPYIRERFADRRQYGPVPYERGQPYIVTHSWGKRFSHAYWGWTRLVQLVSNPELFQSVFRPAFYFRPNRYVMAYAYPVPGSNWYYAGSNILKQKAGKLHELDPVAKYERWKATFEELGRGAVSVAQEGAYLTGWRPAAAETDTAWVRRSGNVLTLRPLWNSGIRHFPAQWAGVAAQLGLIA